jgi:hypothetical protein
MNATEIVGFTADADAWCPACARQVYPDCEEQDVEDREGNFVHPIFAGDEGWGDMTCGGCHETLESLL